MEQPSAIFEGIETEQRFICEIKPNFSVFGRSEVNLSSYENFKMDVLKSTQKDQAYIPDDKTIREMYQSAKNDKIATVQHQTNNTITVSGIIIVICIILFIFHWILLRKISKQEINNEKKLE